MARQRRSPRAQCGSWTCFISLGLTLAFIALVMQHRGIVEHMSVEELIPAIPVVPDIPQPPRKIAELAETVVQAVLPEVQGATTTTTLTSSRSTILAALPQVPSTTLTSSRSTTPAALPQVPSSPETTWECRGDKHNRSCLFRNLYYGKSGANENFVMFVRTDRQLLEDDIKVHRANKYEGFWKPDVRKFSEVGEISSLLSSKVLVQKDGLSVYFNPLFHHNIGHAIFDGLYPAYVALVKFGLQSRPFRPVVGVHENCFADNLKRDEYGPGDTVEAYLFHPVHGRTVFPMRAKVVQVPLHDETAKPLCEFRAGMDHSGLELGAEPVGSGDDEQKKCCIACALTRGCLVGVLFAHICYFKGTCTDGTVECFYRKPERVGIQACRLYSLDQVAKTTLEPLPPEKVTEVHVPWYWVLGRVRRRCMTEDIYEHFGRRNDTLRSFEMQRASRANPDVFIRFEEIVIGVGGVGNMVADESGAIGGSLAPYHAMASFRDRMLLSHGLPTYPAESRRKTHLVSSGTPVQVIVIANKRFTKTDQDTLKHVIEMANKHTSAGQNMKAEFIDWGAITGPDGKFAAHLRRVQEAHVYVSSIGTALQYVPFLRDGSVYIALGSVWGRGGRQFPTFMEQQLAGGGTPYLRTLYADPGKVLRDDRPHPSYKEDGYFAAVDGDLVFQLLGEAEQLVRNGFRIPVPPEENLSKEARILLELCRLDPAGCRGMQSSRNGEKFECTRILWNECIVYEIGPWGDGTCEVNHNLLRTLRVKYGLSNYGLDLGKPPAAGIVASPLAPAPVPINETAGNKWETTWECIGPKTNRSCYFRNLYFGMDGPSVQFMVYVVGDKQIPDFDVKRANKYEGFWRPILHKFGSVEELKNVASSHILHEVPGLTVQFNPLFHNNIGHAIFDGLYPAYVALVKFGLHNRSFRPLPGVTNDCFEDGLGLNGAAYSVGDTVETYLPDQRLERTLWPKRAKVVGVPRRKEKEGGRCIFVKDMDDSGLDMGGEHVGHGREGEDKCARLCERTRRCQAGVLFREVCYLKGPCPAGRQKCNYYKPGPYLCNLGTSSAPMAAKVVVRPEDDPQSQEVEVPESWVIGRVRRRCMSEYIYKEFGMSGEQMPLFEIERDARSNPDLLLRFDEIVFGVGGAGNMIVDDSGAIAGSLAPYNAMASFRDRMLRAYSLPIPKPGIHPLAPNEKLRIIVIANKRFDPSDRTKLESIIMNANKKGGVEAEFIDWAKISSKDGKFKEHLRHVQRAHVYVSSIGTALQYVPFLRDGCAYIALGSVWGRDGRQFPTFMEQQLAGGGTPYLRTIYADPGKVLRDNKPHPAYGQNSFFAAIDEPAVAGLFERAEAIVRLGFHIPVPPHDNLSVEARILLELCQEDPQTCMTMQDHRNGANYECALLLWNEPVVYEVGPWGDGRCAVNRQKLRELRRKYGVSGYGAKED